MSKTSLLPCFSPNDSRVAKEILAPEGNKEEAEAVFYSSRTLLPQVRTLSVIPAEMFLRLERSK